MIEPRDLSKRTQDLRRAFEAKLGVKSRSLPQALKRAGRRLPKRLRKQGALLVRTEKLAQNPKLARQIKTAEVDHAFEAISTHLAAIDVADRRKGRILAVAGAIAANVLVITGLFVWWLWDNGYVGI